MDLNRKAKTILLKENTGKNPYDPSLPEYFVDLQNQTINDKSKTQFPQNLKITTTKQHFVLP